MSEFIGACPKCQQQILCDTAYVGKRVACPVCLQEITMPAPLSRGAAAGPAELAPGVSRPETAGRQNLMIVAIAVGVGLLALAVGAIAIFALRKPSQPTAPAPGAVASAPVPKSVPAPVAATVQNPASVQEPADALRRTQDPCRAIWTFDEDNGTTVPDTTGNGNLATLVGDKAVWTGAAKVGSGALSLGGLSYAETPGPVVNTAQSFSVVAWVNISAFDNQHNQTVVSVDGAEISGFYLMLYHSGPKFAFNRSDGDDKRATRTMATATFNAVPNIWYHLAGVFDAGAKTLSLYVNGNLEQTVPFGGAWQAMGKTAIGRGFYGHANVDFLNGTVDDVRLYSTALTAAQVQALASK
jgi:alpha-N-arabinofuranosidase